MKSYAPNHRRITISRDKNPSATGYLLRWGTDPEELYTTMEVYDGTSIDLGCFHADLPYYFRLDTFNKNGVPKGSEMKRVQ